MRQIVTLLLTTFLLLIWLGNAAFAGSEIPAPAETNTAPVDSPKKEQAPPPQMLTYPLISNICKITFSSYVQTRFQYYLDNKTPSNFDIRNARLIFNGTPFRNLAYRLQVDFAPPTVRVLDAYAAYTFVNPYLKVTVGQQKVPLSWESLRTDYDILSMSRSQVVEALTARSKDVLAGTTAVNNNGRDIGVLVSGAIPNTNTNANWVEYYAGVFNGNGINKTDLDKNKDIAGRVLVFPIKQLSLGGSVYQGKATYGVDLTKPKDRNRWGVEAAFNTERFRGAAEYLQGTDSTTEKGGYYGLVEGFFIPKKFAALVKYDFYDPNKNKDGDATTIYSFALNWYFAAYTKVQLQYDYRREEGGDATQKKNDLLSAQVQVFF